MKIVRLLAYAPSRWNIRHAPCRHILMRTRWLGSRSLFFAHMWDRCSAPGAVSAGAARITQKRSKPNGCSRHARPTPTHAVVVAVGEVAVGRTLSCMAKA